MPIGKQIYDVISKRHGARHQKMSELSEERIRSGPQEPPTIQQSKKNEASRTIPMNIHITEAANLGLRLISPNEGMPAVNGESGPELVKKAVTKVRPKTKTLDPTAGAIEPVNAGRKCSQCKQSGHTKRTCSNKGGSSVKRPRKKASS